MTIKTEPIRYEKTVLTDLLSAWIDFREAVADSVGFMGREKVLLQIDEALSWKTVRDLKLMPPIFLSARNLCTLGDAPDHIQNRLDEINGFIVEALEEDPK